jgi:hypothetical protein
MLLRRMADFQPELVTAAYVELGATHAQYLTAHNRWQVMLHSKRAPRGLRLYQAVLGPADTERRELWGDLALTACTWRLPGLWPDLRWETLATADGTVLHGALVRAIGQPAPELPAPGQMAPWSCVVGDVQLRYPDARQADAQTPAQWLAFLTDEQGQQWRLVFVHGLLQAIRAIAG